MTHVTPSWVLFQFPNGSEFKLLKFREHTDIPNNSAYKALTHLQKKDLIGKTNDECYHALNDQHVAQTSNHSTKGAVPNRHRNGGPIRLLWGACRPVRSPHQEYGSDFFCGPL